jgi:hypothetical protein
MTINKKTDNSNMRAKLELRRYFLRKYHADGRARVLDCCQGSGLIWNTLRQEFDLDSYWGVDLKPKRGRLKIDSTRILSQPGWTQNVIDIDTYGSPWKHWTGMLPNVTQPTTVFLTVGQITKGKVGSVDNISLRAAGLVFPTLRLPAAFHVKLADIFPSYCLAISCDHDIIITEAVEAVSTGSARYFGVRLRPTHS